jgi:hypothetical protein
MAVRAEDSFPYGGSVPNKPEGKGTGCRVPNSTASISGCRQEFLAVGTLEPAQRAAKARPLMWWPTSLTVQSLSYGSGNPCTLYRAGSAGGR